MLTKNQMREILTAELEDLDVDDADEVADTLVDRLEDAGAFEVAGDDE